LLLRFVDGVSKGISRTRDEPGSEGIKMRLDALGPVVEILNTASICVIGSNGDAVGAGLASLELEGVDGGFSEKVRDASDVFELITHCSPSTHQHSRQIFNLIIYSLCVHINNNMPFDFSYFLFKSGDSHSESIHPIE